MQASSATGLSGKGNRNRRLGGWVAAAVRLHRRDGHLVPALRDNPLARSYIWTLFAKRARQMHLPFFTPTELTNRHPCQVSRTLHMDYPLRPV